MIRPGIWTFVCLFWAFGFSQDLPVPKVKVLSEEFIFEEAPFAQCHASTLIVMADGSVMAGVAPINSLFMGAMISYEPGQDQGPFGPQ